MSGIKERAWAARSVWRRPDALRLDLVVGAAAASVLLAYAAARAWALSFTHDESLTYTRFVGQSVGSLVRYDEATANHHLVNTLLMKAADGVAGPSELALRFGSVAACVAYLAVVLVWTREVRSRTLGALGFTLACANPYVLDFFSLARGYGMGLACVSAAALFAVRFAKRATVRRALAAGGAGALAVVANFALLPFFASLCVALLAFAVLARRRSVPGSPTPGAIVGVLGGIAAVLAAVVAAPVVRLRREGELYFGGDAFRDTLGSLVDGSLYGAWPAGVGAGVKVAVVVVGVVAAAVTIRLAIRASPLLPPSTMIGLLTTLPAGLSVAQHHLLGTPYPLGRTALFLVPLAALWIATAADELGASTHVARGALRAGSAALVLLALANVAAAANVSHTYDWRYDADTERIMADLDAVARRRDERPLSVGATWLLEPTINFYRGVKSATAVGEVVRDCRVDCLAGEHHAYVALGADVEIARQRGALIVKRYPTSGAVLLTAGGAGPAP